MGVEGFDDVTMIAVVDAAARWLEEPDGDEYAYALLGAVTDGPTQLRAYGELLGTGSGVAVTEGIWAAAGIRMPQLSAKERDHLAVLRVAVLAADPAEPKVPVRRVDVLTALAVVDRLAQGPAVESVMVADKATAGVALFAGSVRVSQTFWRLRLRFGRKSRRRPDSTRSSDV